MIPRSMCQQVFQSTTRWGILESYGWLPEKEKYGTGYHMEGIKGEGLELRGNKRVHAIKVSWEWKNGSRELYFSMKIVNTSSTYLNHNVWTLLAPMDLICTVICTIIETTAKITLHAPDTAIRFYVVVSFHTHKSAKPDSHHPRGTYT